MYIFKNSKYKAKQLLDSPLGAALGRLKVDWETHKKEASCFV